MDSAEAGPEVVERLDASDKCTHEGSPAHAGLFLFIQKAGGISAGSELHMCSVAECSKPKLRLCSFVESIFQIAKRTALPATFLIQNFILLFRSDKLGTR